MFYYQIEVASENLSYPPVIVSTHRLNLGEIDPPMITICPLNQMNETILKNYGYQTYFDLLAGKKTLGAAMNKTANIFWNIINKSLTYSPKEDVDFEIRFEGNSINNMSHFIKRFYPKFGFCWEITDYQIKDELKIIGEKLLRKVGKAKIFLTDKLLRTMPALDLSNQRGHDIEMIVDKEITHFIEIAKVSIFDPRKPKNCKEYTDKEFEECVDLALANLTHGVLVCQPPWKTSTNSCTDMNWTKIPSWQEILQFGLAYTVYELDIQRIIEMENFPARKACPKPCSVTRSNIRNGSLKKKPKGNAG